MPAEHILTEIINRPLLVTPAKLEVILSIVNSRGKQNISPDFSALSHMNSLSGQEVRAESRPLNSLGSEQAMTIAMIPVLGSMVARNHGRGGGDDSGLRSYRSLMMEINAAAKDSSIGGIMLDIDTFGGMSAGCERVTRLIASVNAIKPVYGLVDLNCYSAGYSIASACSRIILTDQTAGVGSIGCIAIHCDMSKYHDKEGLNYTVVTFGAKKDQFSAFRPLAKDEAAELQKSVSAHGLRFAETVAELRGLKLADVLATEAAVYSGQEAINIGLADNIASFDEAMAMLADEIETRKKTSFTNNTFMEGKNMPEAMSTKQRMEKLLTADDGPAAIKELGYIPLAEAAAAAELAGKEAATAVQTAADATRVQLIDVAELCQLADLSCSDTVATLKSGMDTAQARADIQSKKAQKSTEQTVKSTITPLSGDGKHPLIASCGAVAGLK
jgi:capsid assembly protease